MARTGSPVLCMPPRSVTLCAVGVPHAAVGECVGGALGPALTGGLATSVQRRLRSGLGARGSEGAQLLRGRVLLGA